MKDAGCMEKLQAFKGRHIDGHAPLLRGNDLNGYISAGIRTEHEATSAEEALEKLEQLGPQAGFKNQQEMRNAAATLAFEAKVSGLERIDHVALGSNGQGLFAVQGRLDDPAHHRIYADREAAVQQPVERSSQQWQQDAQQQQTQQQAQQREPHRMSM